MLQINIVKKIILLAGFLIAGLFVFSNFASALTACEISCGAVSPYAYYDYCSDGSDYIGYALHISGSCVPDSQAILYDGYCREMSANSVCCDNSWYKRPNYSKHYWTTNASCLEVNTTCLCDELQPTTCSGSTLPECKLVGTTCSGSSDCCFDAVCKDGYCGTLGSCLPAGKSCTCDSQCCAGDCSSGECTGPSVENCYDNVDNDGDGLIDCLDPDCPNPEGYCENCVCSPTTYDWVCNTITSCFNSDSCCPVSCTFTQDNDCTGVCSGSDPICTVDCCPSGSRTASCEGCPSNGYVSRGSYWTGVCSYTGQCYCCDCADCPDPSTYCADDYRYSCSTLCPLGTSSNCAPPEPTNLTHIANTITSITWQWNKVAGTVTKYQLFDNNWNLLQDNINPATACGASYCSFQENGLAANYQYHRKVKACNAYGCSDYSNTASAYTSIQAVNSAECVAAGSNFITVRAISDGPSGLFSGLSNGSSGIWFQSTTTSVGLWQNSSTYTFTGLSPVKNYAFKAGPSRNGDAEQTLGTVYVGCSTTPSEIPNSPTLSWVSSSLTTINWQWAPSGSGAPSDSYALYVRCQNLLGEPCPTGTWYNIANVGSGVLTYPQTRFYSSNSWNLELLSHNFIYGFGVSACRSGYGCSAIATVLEATAIEQPTDVSYIGQTLTSLDIAVAGSFSNLAAGLSGVDIREEKTGLVRGFSSLLNWSLSGLIPGERYTFNAKARNITGHETPEVSHSYSTEYPTRYGSIRVMRPGVPSNVAIKLALIAIDDALLIGRGIIKVQKDSSSIYAAYLVETDNSGASPVRVKTPMGIKSWRVD